MNQYDNNDIDINEDPNIEMHQQKPLSDEDIDAMYEQHLNDNNKQGEMTMTINRYNNNNQVTKHHAAKVFFDHCVILKTKLDLGVANLFTKINGLTITQIDTTDLTNLDYQIAQNQRTYKYLLQAQDKISKLNDLIRALPKSSDCILNGEFKWGNFWIKLSNVNKFTSDYDAIMNKAELCLCNLINPKNPTTKEQRQ